MLSGFCKYDIHAGLSKISNFGLLITKCCLPQINAVYSSDFSFDNYMYPHTSIYVISTKWCKSCLIEFYKNLLPIGI